MSGMDELHKLIERLDNIAKKNDEKFIYRIEIKSTEKGILFTFVCEKTDHVFIEGCKWGLPGCIDDAKKDIPRALNLWNFIE